MKEESKLYSVSQHCTH